MSSRNCYHILHDISGDHVAVYPTNEEVMVNRIGELLGVDLDTVITLTNTDGK